ncbi:MAG: ATP-binding protein [Bacteroidales bacterium]
MQLKRQSIVLISVVVILFFGIVAYILSNRLISSAEEMAYSIAHLTAQSNTYIVESELNKSLYYSRVLSRALGHQLQKDGFSEDWGRAAAEATLDIEKEFLGAWFYAKNPNGQEHFWYVGKRGEKRSLFDKDYKAIVDTIRARQKEYISEPYFLKDTSLVISLAVPFFTDNGYKGVVAVELGLNELHSKFTKVEGFGYGYVSVASSDALYVAHPEQSVLGEKDTNKIDQARFIAMVDSPAMYDDIVQSEYLGLPVYRVYNPLQLGYVERPWTIMVSIPMISFTYTYDRIRNYASIIVLASVLALILILIFGVQRWFYEGKQRLKAERAHTHLKAMQNRLILSEKMASLGELTAGIAHELNNPINFIVANISPLKRDIQELKAKRVIYSSEIDELFQEIDELLEGMEEGAERTAGIVGGLREFSGNDEGGVHAVQLYNAWESSMKILHHKYAGKIEMVNQLPEDLQVVGIPGKLNQVFLNLLNNAIQAIEERSEKEKSDFRGTIVIEGENHQDEVVVRLSDNGMGIKNSDIAHVFEPFFTTKEVGRGTGLGLSICYSIINQHKGRLEVTSQRGEGTCFTLFLPK